MSAATPATVTPVDDGGSTRVVRPDHDVRDLARPDLRHVAVPGRQRPGCLLRRDAPDSCGRGQLDVDGEVEVEPAPEEEPAGDDDRPVRGDLDRRRADGPVARGVPERRQHPPVAVRSGRLEHFAPECVQVDPVLVERVRVVAAAFES